MTDLVRDPLERLAPPWSLALAVFLVHAAIRFGGLRWVWAVPLSMALVWPLPWLLSDREGRRAIGLRSAPPRWLALGPLVGLAALLLCFVAAWTGHGSGASNWFAHHAAELARASRSVPPGASTGIVFASVTVPAMIFSPLAEEFLFRGYLLAAFALEWGERAGQVVQAAAFALVHLAHYGLRPFDPALLPVWLGSMFAVALVLGWIVRRSGSLWPAVLAHATFNLGMNAVAFVAFPDVVR